MIEIRDEHFLAEGTYQKCYLHPENDNLCIKTSKLDIDTSRLLYELKYCKKISKKNPKKLEYPFFSKYYGKVETNLGDGFVFDLIKDETTGEVSKTMEYYILNRTPEINDDVIQKGFDKLIELMGKHNVIANDIRSKNICCKILKDKSIQMILVDGAGHRDFLPLVDWFSYFSKKKIERRLVKHSLTDIDTHREYLINLDE